MSKEQSATKPVQSLGAMSPPKAQKNKEKSATKSVQPVGVTSPPEVQKNNEKSLPKWTKHGGKSSHQPQLTAETPKPTDKEAEAKGSEKTANSRSKLVNKEGKKSATFSKKDSSKPKPAAKSNQKKKQSTKVGNKRKLEKEIVELSDGEEEDSSPPYAAARWHRIMREEDISDDSIEVIDTSRTGQVGWLVSLFQLNSRYNQLCNLNLVT